MSNINGASGSHYISNIEILAWMQERTNGIYTKMGQAMDMSNNRADAEDALNNIKSKIADVQAGKGDPNELYALMHETIAQYSEAFPELAGTLSPIATELKGLGARLPDGADAVNQWIPAPPPKTIPATQRTPETPNPAYEAWAHEYGADAAEYPECVKTQAPANVTVDKDTATRWTNAIKDRVDAFGKDDQLALINIQEFNAQLNQAKQTASALMDASDKAANNTISHIS